MNNKLLIALTAVAAVVIAVGAVWWLTRGSAAPTDSNLEAGREASSTEQAIREVLFATATPSELTLYKQLEEGNGGFVNIVDEGDRYALFAILTYKSAGPSPRIFDKQTKTIVGSLPEGFEFPAGKGHVVISKQDICYYRITEPRCIPLRGARLMGHEVYPYANYDWPVFPHASSTGFTLVVGVYDRDPIRADATEVATTTEVRALTFTLP